MKTPVLVSACLIGAPVRYDGRAKLHGHDILARWQAEAQLIAVCPEVMAGFAVPRLTAEIADGASGDDVLDGRARVLDSAGIDVTDAFLTGARLTLDLALTAGARHAVLTEASPSCGSSLIHDGRFSGQRHGGQGVTTALLRRHGIAVCSEQEIESLDRLLTAQD